MSSSFQTSDARDTTKRCETKASKGSPTDSQVAEPLLATGNDAQPPKQLSLASLPKRTLNMVTISAREYLIPNPPSTTSTTEFIDDLELSQEFLKSTDCKVRGPSSSYASLGQLVMGFVILLCMIYPGIIGRIPLVPRLIYDAIDPFASFVYDWKADP